MNIVPLAFLRWFDAAGVCGCRLSGPVDQEKRALSLGGWGVCAGSRGSFSISGGGRREAKTQPRSLKKQAKVLQWAVVP